MINIPMTLVGHLLKFSFLSFIYVLLLLLLSTTTHASIIILTQEIWVCAIISRPTNNTLIQHHLIFSPNLTSISLFFFFPLWWYSSHPSERGTCLSVSLMSKISAPQAYLARITLSLPSISPWVFFLHLCSVPLFLALTRKHRLCWN